VRDRLLAGKLLRMGDRPALTDAGAERAKGLLEQAD